MSYTGPRSAPFVTVALIQGGGSQPSPPLDLGGRLVSMKFTESDDKPDKIEIVLRNDDLFFLDSPLLDNGQAIWVQWGYPEKAHPPRMLVIKRFKGGVSTARRQKIGQWSGDFKIIREFNTVTVEGTGLEIEFGKIPRRRSHFGIKASDMARKIAQEYGYPPSAQFIAESSYVYECLPQGGQSDAAFLYRLCLMEGFQWYVDDKGFHFSKRDYSAPTDHVLIWRTDPRGTILGLAFDNNMSGAVGAVTTRGYDATKRRPISAKTSGDGKASSSVAGMSSSAPFAAAAAPGDVYGPTLTTYLNQDPRDTPVSSVDLASATGTVIRARDNAGGQLVVTAGEKTVAGSEEKAARKSDARYRKSRENLVKLRVNVIGDPTIFAKQTVELMGIGKRLSGRYRITDITTTIENTYDMELKLSGNATGNGVVPTALPTKAPKGGKDAQLGEIAVTADSGDGRGGIAVSTADGSQLASEDQAAQYALSGKASTEYYQELESSPSATSIDQAAREQQRFLNARVAADQAAFGNASTVRPAPPPAAYEQLASEPFGTPEAPASGGG